ncbi:hypothetical protein TWF281_009347 [Arthrobotrys megalospora]
MAMSNRALRGLDSRIRILERGEEIDVLESRVKRLEDEIRILKADNALLTLSLYNSNALLTLRLYNSRLGPTQNLRFPRDVPVEQYPTLPQTRDALTTFNGYIKAKNATQHARRSGY